MKRALLHLAVGVVLIAFCAGARAFEIDEEGRIVLTDAERAACARQGGCTIATDAYLKSLASKECKKPESAPPPRSYPRKNDT